MNYLTQKTVKQPTNFIDWKHGFIQLSKWMLGLEIIMVHQEILGVHLQYLLMFGQKYLNFASRPSCLGKTMKNVHFRVFRTEKGSKHLFTDLKIQKTAEKTCLSGLQIEKGLKYQFFGSLNSKIGRKHPFFRVFKSKKLYET